MLRELKQLKSVPQLMPLIRTVVTIDKSNLSQIELILHSTNLCFFTMRVLRNEIFINNRNRALAMAMKEIKKLNTILSKSDYYEETISHKEAKETFKRLGVKQKHLKA